MIVVVCDMGNALSPNTQPRNMNNRGGVKLTLVLFGAVIAWVGATVVTVVVALVLWISSTLAFADCSQEGAISVCGVALGFGIPVLTIVFSAFWLVVELSYLSLWAVGRLAKLHRRTLRWFVVPCLVLIVLGLSWLVVTRLQLQGLWPTVELAVIAAIVGVVQSLWMEMVYQSLES